MKINNNIGLILLSGLICAIFSFNKGYAQTSQTNIKHKTGIYYNDLLPNGMQKTHEYRTTVYVNPGASNSNITLDLPSKSSTSPHKYYRWYDYNTDGASARFTSGGTMYTNGRVLYNTNSTTNVFDNITYQVPISSSFVANTVACDVSANTDYTLSGSNLSIEPTLSYRCIYDIRHASEIANQLRDVTDAGGYLEDRIIYMPKNPASTKALPRVTLKYNPTNYFGYNSSNALVAGSTTSITASGTGVTATPSGRFIFINPASVTGNQTIVTVKMTIGTKIYNIARFTVNFTSDAPMTYSTLTGSSERRSINYLNSNYVLLSKLDFDYDTSPATAANNMWPNPLSWDICTYGFSSKKLFENNPRLRGFSNRVSQWNEYGFYKTANVSLADISGYTWYNEGRTVYDRLYQSSGGAQSGYFMYIDAAESPGIVAKLPIDQLCSGTKLIVSAGVASLTSAGSASYPNLNFVFLGVDANGNEVELNRYTSGDIPSASGSTTPWYQMYYSFTFDSKGVDYVSYKLQVENNCTSTSGGDYAVDDIRIYRSKPTVQANQITLPCGSDAAEVKVRVEYEKLLLSLGKNEVTSGNGEKVVLKYKFLDHNKNAITYDYGTPTNYGQISLSTKFSEMTAMPATGEAPRATGDANILTYTETQVIDGITYRYVVFRTPNNNSLEINQTYYTVVANSSGVFGTDMCSMISDPFIIKPPFNVTVDGASWTDGDGMCYGNSITLGAKLRDRITHEDINCRFDWFIGTQSEFNASISGGITAEIALQRYRIEYPNPTVFDTGLSAVKGTFTQQAHDILANLIANNKLIINQKQIVRIIRFGESVLAVPIVKTAETTATTTTLTLCSNYIPIQAGEPHKNPTLRWSPISTPTSVRLSLKHFEDLKSASTKTLTVPVNNFKNADQSRTRDLKKASDVTVYLIATDDPTIVVDSLIPLTAVATIKDISVTADGIDNDYIVFQNWRNVTMQEGYTYKVEFKFNQILLNGDMAACDGVTAISFKIVPEYLTWNGTSSDNWNNDNNWIRSTKAELQKDISGQNTDNYQDISSPLARKGFVPMKHTKVTIPKGALTMPWLYSLQGSPYLNMVNSNYTTISDQTTNAATSDIEYDLAVKANGANYNCESFYGNTCDQIHFKSLAEMRNTNFLTYNKANVEFELVSGRWYMLSSPLKSVVAGDMYLPTTGGRQLTEAFRPITFSTSLHNRFNPAVYQRSWDKTNSLIIRTSGGALDSYIASNWSQVYNKVEEAYGSGVGFSIKPVYGTEGVDKVLFRLPKNDTQYSYYTYNGSYIGNPTTIDRTSSGRLIFENNAANVQVSIANQSSNNNIFLVGNPFMATLDMKKFFDENPNFNRKFWLITTNGIGAVQIALDGTITASGDDILSGKVVPMQSFFVERSSITNTSNVIFTPNMTTTPQSAAIIKSAKSLNESNDYSFRVKATRGGISSSILIRYKPNSFESYDAEENSQALFDSNLDNVPVLYSISDNRAFIINTINNRDSVSLGIYNNENEKINLSFNCLNQSDNIDVKLYDKLENKEYRIKSDKDSISVFGNSHGRYYLAFSDKNQNIANDENSIQIYSKGRGRMEVRLLGSDMIQNIKVYSLTGALIKDLNPSRNSIDVDLPSGQAYVFKVRTDYSSYSRKAYCK